jgi:hypothetical protein
MSTETDSIDKIDSRLEELDNATCIAAGWGADSPSDLLDFFTLFSCIDI